MTFEFVCLATRFNNECVRVTKCVDLLAFGLIVVSKLLNSQVFLFSSK